MEISPSYPPSFAPLPLGALAWEQAFLDACHEWAGSITYVAPNAHASGDKLYAPINTLGIVGTLIRRIAMIAHDDPRIHVLNGGPLVVDRDFSAVWVDRRWLRKTCGAMDPRFGWVNNWWLKFWVAFAEAALGQGIFDSSDVEPLVRFQKDFETRAAFDSESCKDFSFRVLESLSPPPSCVRKGDGLASGAPTLTQEQAEAAGFRTKSFPFKKTLPISQEGEEWAMFAHLALRGENPQFDQEEITALIPRSEKGIAQWVSRHAVLDTPHFLATASSVRDPAVLPLYASAGVNAGSSIPADSLHLLLDLPFVTTDVPWLAYALRLRPELVIPLWEGLAVEEKPRVRESLVGPLEPWRLLLGGLHSISDQVMMECVEWIVGQNFPAKGYDLTPLFATTFKDYPYLSSNQREKALAHLVRVLDMAVTAGAVVNGEALLKDLTGILGSPQWFLALKKWIPDYSAVSDETKSQIYSGLTFSLVSAVIPRAQWTSLVEPWEAWGWRWERPLSYPDAQGGEGEAFAESRHQYWKALGKSQALESHLPQPSSSLGKPRF